IEIEVPAGHGRFLRSHAVGTQNYVCLPCPSPFPSPSSCPSPFAWSLAGPQATLFNDYGTQISTHFLSPNPEEANMPRATWQDSRNTNAVWAKAIQSSSDSDFVESDAIPWLLLEVVGSEPEPDEGGRLTKTTYIQRVNTKGGLAPSIVCDQGNVGVRKFIDYEADYIFYKDTWRK
ncbi:MAG TPA: DUF3455 domain-containing protein, partial [Candidatus Tectomicrobia bacterium]